MKTTINTPWKTENAPQDGTIIIAMGRVIYEFGLHEDDLDDSPIGACSEPFLAQVRWTANEGESAGWHFLDGLSVARTLEDKVMVDFWIEPPAAVERTSPHPSPHFAAPTPQNAEREEQGKSGALALSEPEVEVLMENA